MRKTFGAALTVILVGFTSGAARADEQADLKALIEKAVVATGGREKLSKYKAYTIKMKGKATAMGMTFDFVMDLMVHEPDKSKFSMDIDVMGQKINIIQVVKGDMGWMRNSITNSTDELSKEQLAEHKEQSYAKQVESLVELNGKGYKFAPLGESKVGDSDVVGARVSSAGHRDVSLYFDKSTNLLVKSETTAKDPMAGDKEFAQETLYSEYKEVQGIKFAVKLLVKRDGMEYLNGEITDWQPVEKLDDSLFVKP